MWNSGQTRSAATPPSFRSASSACIGGSAHSPRWSARSRARCDRNGSNRAARDREERGDRLCEQSESGGVLFQVSRRGIRSGVESLLQSGGAERLPVRLEPADPGRRVTSVSGHRGCDGRVGARIFRYGCRHTVCSRQSFPASRVAGRPVRSQAAGYATTSRVTGVRGPVRPVGHPCRGCPPSMRYAGCGGSYERQSRAIDSS